MASKMLPLTLIDGLIGHLPQDGLRAGTPRKHRTRRVTTTRSGLAVNVPTPTSLDIGLVGAALGAREVSKNCDSTTAFRFSEDRGVVVRALYFTRSVLEVLYDHWPREGTFAFPPDSQLSIFRRAIQWPEADFDKNAKYFFIRMMAQFRHQDLPAPPPSSYGSIEGHAWLLFSGPVRRYIKSRLVNSTTSRPACHLFEGFLQGGKRGCYQVSETLVESSLRKHMATLSKNREYPTWFESDDDRPTRLRAKIKQIVRILYPKKMEDLSLLEPTSSAALGIKRSEGGAKAGVQQYLTKNFPYPTEDQFALGLGTVLDSMVEVRPGEVVENRMLDIPSFREVLDNIKDQYSLEPLSDLVPPDKTRTTNLASWFSDLDNQAWDLRPKTMSDPDGLIEPSAETHGPVGTSADHGSWLHALYEQVRLEREAEFREHRPTLSSAVKVSPVLEPLKVRLISKGESLKYWLSRPFQRYMWRGLQRSPIFRLTGRPLMEADLWDLVGSSGEDGSLWNSGDYSAATDNIKMSWTIEAFEAILEQSGLPYDYQALLRRVIYGQKLTYQFAPNPDANSERSEVSVWQRSGQLMGSPLSFPILCILNLAAYWLALEEVGNGKYRCSIPMNKLRVLINGDDILFRVPSEGVKSRLYQTWLRMLDHIGFELSLGKNYICKDYLCINSQGYTWRSSGRIFSKIGFLNVGLLLGKSKVARRESAELTPLQGRYKEVVGQAWNPARAHDRFIHYNREAINAMTMNGKYSLTVDPLLGGLGFPRFPGVKTYVTTFQRAFASYLLQKLEKPWIGRFDPRRPYIGIISVRSPPMKLTRELWSWGSFCLRSRLCPLQQGEEVASAPADSTKRPLQEMVSLSHDVGTERKGKPKMVVRPPPRRVLDDFCIWRKRVARKEQSVRSIDLHSLSETRWWVRLATVLG